MPKINLDSLLTSKISVTQKRIEELQNETFFSAKIETYKEWNLNDNSWLTMNEPEVWESQELGEFDGVVWLRKHIILTKQDIENNAILNIPAIDDDDITYVNGVKIGETKGWDKKRTYVINANILKVGDNVISIRVVDSAGSGGIYGDASNFNLNIDKKEITSEQLADLSTLSKLLERTDKLYDFYLKSLRKHIFYFLKKRFI